MPAQPPSSELRLVPSPVCSAELVTRGLALQQCLSHVANVWLTIGGNARQSYVGYKVVLKKYGRHKIPHHYTVCWPFLGVIPVIYPAL